VVSTKPPKLRKGTVRTFKSYLQNEIQLLSMIIGREGTRRNHLNLQQRLFRQALKKSFQNVKWEQLLRVAIESPSSEIFKN